MTSFPGPAASGRSYRGLGGSGKTVLHEANTHMVVRADSAGNVFLIDPNVVTKVSALDRRTCRALAGRQYGGPEATAFDCSDILAVGDQIFSKSWAYDAVKDVFYARTETNIYALDFKGGTMTPVFSIAKDAPVLTREGAATPASTANFRIAYVAPHLAFEPSTRTLLVATGGVAGASALYAVREEAAARNRWNVTHILGAESAPLAQLPAAQENVPQRSIRLPDAFGELAFAITRDGDFYFQVGRDSLLTPKFGFNLVAGIAHVVRGMSFSGEGAPVSLVRATPTVEAEKCFVNPKQCPSLAWDFAYDPARNRIFTAAGPLVAPTFAVDRAFSAALSGGETLAFLSPDYAVVGAGFENGRVYEADLAAGTRSTIYGFDALGAEDDQLAVNRYLSQVVLVEEDKHGNVFFTDAHNLQRVDLQGNVATLEPTNGAMNALNMDQSRERLFIRYYANTRCHFIDLAFDKANRSEYKAASRSRHYLKSVAFPRPPSPVPTSELLTTAVPYQVTSRYILPFATPAYGPGTCAPLAEPALPLYEVANSALQLKDGTIPLAQSGLSFVKSAISSGVAFRDLLSLPMLGQSNPEMADFAIGSKYCGPDRNTECLPTTTLLEGSAVALASHRFPGLNQIQAIGMASAKDEEILLCQGDRLLLVDVARANVALLSPEVRPLPGRSVLNPRCGINTKILQAHEGGDSGHAYVSFQEAAKLRLFRFRSARDTGSVAVLEEVEIAGHDYVGGYLHLRTVTKDWAYIADPSTDRVVRMKRR